MVCMHCEDPTCAQVCPADAIKQTEDGIVQSALKPRCIGCSNCVLACPFGVPKMIAEFDQMMKCDMCTDRTSEGLKPMCASVCPSQALWYGTIEEFDDTRRGSLLRDFLFGRQEVRTKVYTVVDDLDAGPLDVLGGDDDELARRPVRPRRRGADDERRPGTPVPLWRRDFPYEAAAEEEVTRREFTRYLVLGAGAMAAGNVGIAAWTQLRSINTGEPRPIVALADVAGRCDVPVPLPDRRRPGRAAARSATASVVAFSQKCTHLGCVVYYEAEQDRWHCPCHEGNFEARTGHVISGPPTAAARAHRRRGPRRRPGLGAGQGRVTAPMRISERGRRTSSAVAVYVIILVASRCSCSPSPSRRSSPTRRRSPGRPPPCPSSLAAGAALFLRWLRP